jgi:hypothetical protein
MAMAVEQDFFAGFPELELAGLPRKKLLEEKSVVLEDLGLLEEHAVLVPK